MATKEQLRAVETAKGWNQGNIAGLDDAMTRRLVASTALTESSGGDLRVTNSAGYVGRYQAGAGWLVDAGYLDREKMQAAMRSDGIDPQSRGAEWKWATSGGMTEFLENDANWKNGLTLEKYKASEDLQDAAFKTVCDRTYRQAVKDGHLSESDPDEKVAGFLKARHISGYGGAIQAVQGKAGPSDVNGTNNLTYYNHIVQNKDGLNQLMGRAAESPQPTNPSQGKTTGEGTWPAPGNYSLTKGAGGQGDGGYNSSRPAHRDGDGHDGVDIQGKIGDPIKAFKGGTVVFAGVMGGYGNTIDIRHDDGSVTRYAHLDKINVQKDKPVTEGQVIGTLGDSGNAKGLPSPHLHFEIRKGGKDVDPMPILNNAKREDGTQPGRTESVPGPRPASGAMADGVLKFGDRGPEVREYLEKLDKLGYRGPKGESLLANQPEIFGPAAKFATEQLQKAHGLKVDGKAGTVETLPAVDKALKAPLLSEANHPANGYYRSVAAQIEKIRPGTDPLVVMNVAKEGLQEGFKDPQVGYSKGQDLFAIAPKPGPGVTPGLQTRVEASLPDASAQSLSDRAARDFKAMQEEKAPQATVTPDPNPVERRPSPTVMV